MGLREQIKNAGSEAEINDLISKGRTFEYASDRTKNSWKSTARYRLSELNNPVPVQTPSESVGKKTKVKTKKK